MNWSILDTILMITIIVSIMRNHDFQLRVGNYENRYSQVISCDMSKEHNQKKNTELIVYYKSHDKNQEQDNITCVNS